MAPRDDDLTQDSILRNARVGAWLLGLALLALPLVGMIRWPHPVWAAPLCCALLGLAANYRIGRATGRGETILLAVLTLVLLVGAGALAEVALNVAR
ncbi:hypothetical protein ABZ345_28940 [Lentzea sp. NPDC005914]|uniref:hypothetical protein n=1 Tax=Lentzea sp. NPDC005914 TaxID=3154572 RepID=UPI00340313F4